MGSDWNYYTNIKPRRKRSKGEDGNTEYRMEFKKSFDNFLEDCKIPIGEIEDALLNEDVYKYNIKTDKVNNHLNKESDYHVQFLKSLFLGNPKFKRGLIEYYNPVGYFINGPEKIDEDNWVIEFSKKIGY